MSLPSWKEHFTQPVTGFDPVEAQGLTELGYALIHNQIDEQEYLSWARAQFEMCSVDMNFFQKHPAPLQLLKRLKESYAWGPEILPMLEWDGHLIVLALEKPTIEIPKELKPIVLLAPVRELHRYWSECLEQLESAVAETPEGESLEAGGLLEGISLEPPSAVTGLDFSGIRPKTPDDTAIITRIENTKIENTKTQKPKPKELKNTDLEATQTDARVSPPPTTEISIEINTVIAKSPPKPLATKAAPSILAPKTPEKIATPEVIKKAEPQVLAVVNPSAPILSEKVLLALSQYAHIYESRCFVEFQPEQKTARVTQWPSDANVSMTPTSMPLDQDSFLKIVAKTQKPYHGHLVKTPVVEQFFKEINKGQIPENVTLVPVVKNGDVVGALMGWGPKTTYSLTVLREIERIVHNLCIELGFTSVEAA